MSHPHRRGLVFIAFCLSAGVLPPSRGRADDAPAGRKYALLVGVHAYNKDELHSLPYTENDVTELGQVLRDAGYKRVVVMTQSEAARAGDNELLPEGRHIRRQLDALLQDRQPGDTVLIAFSGHGVQPTGKSSYFCPMDAQVQDLTTLVRLADVYKALEQSNAGMKLLLVDACRNDPLVGGDRALDRLKLESVTRPQAEKPPGGVAALFSCSEGQRSFESEEFKHGVFFHYVIEGLKGEAANKKGEVGLADLAKYVLNEVPDQAQKEWGTKARQLPQLTGDVTGSAPLATAAPGKTIKNSLGMKLVRIEAGRFTMGSPKDEQGRADNEGPQHEVEITKPFYMGVDPVTKGQFAAFVEASRYQMEAERDGQGSSGYNPATRKFEQAAKYTWRDPGFEQTDQHPVVNVTWNDAKAFCVWLSEKEGKTYELPTEAEWEYACRAGTTTRFWCGNADADLKGNANIADASLNDKLDADSAKSITFASWDDGFAFTSPVGRFGANPWGLHDMHGNVLQWCADRYGKYQGASVTDPKYDDKGEERVLRGGSWGFDPRDCRSAVRGSIPPTRRGFYIGFRTVLRPARTP